ncbi:hypothetical protein [Haloplanus halophilus]|uniref:hypothetical protein n=1 Tax=Haloplanus halophilus TaxID=2949993 RepID=UPI002040B9AC|nr:hypothetical protein [Haloplanus sp. GDY1]
MAQSTRFDRRTQAQAAVNRAMAGELVELRDYSLRRNKGQYLIGVPPEGPDNLAVGKGDELTPYIDFENGFLVFDLCGGGDTHGDD